MNGLKDSDGKINLAHPRTQAAMKVTGITEADLRMKTVDVKNGDHSALHRNEVVEQKRQTLLKELEEVADSLDEEQVQSLMSLRPAGEVDARAWYEGQRAQVERMRGKLKTQLQKEAQRELGKQQTQDTAMKDREAVYKRRQEQQAEKRAQLQEQAEKRAAQMEKVRERLKAGAKAERERRDGITTRLSTDMERVTQVVDSRRSDFKSRVEGSKGRADEIKERKEAREQLLLEEKLRRMEEAMEKDRVVEERISQSQQDTLQKFAEKQGKFTNKMGHVQETLLQQERERQKMYKEHLDKMEACRKAALEETQKVVESTRETRDKRFTKWENTRQTQRSARGEHLRELKVQLQKEEAKSIEVRAKYLEETIYEKAASRGLFHEVVQQNQQRLQRSDEYARAHTLAKIKREIERSKAIETQKKVIMDDRCAAIKESMLGRLRVEELKGVRKDDGESAARRVNGILRDLDMPPLSSAPVHQGEEEQGK
mmetsp:Transcript_77267/g.202728  ORF Transcript_77267/g.202728 Transcript_77267/m.202728 type:complete len:485 (-) Transcript_77267:8-1462(-)